MVVAVDHFPITREPPAGTWDWIGAIVVAVLVVATVIYLYRVGTRRRPRAR